MNITNIFGITRGHEHLDFVDVDCDRDVKLYVDPTLIEHDSSAIGRECNALIHSYFDTVFNAIRCRNLDELWRLSMFAHEPNETCFGSSCDKPAGKGASPDILMAVYADIINQRLLESNMIRTAADIAVVTDNFGFDRLSDLITNVIRRPLQRFTAEQCRKYEYSLSPDMIYIGHGWSPEAAAWGELTANAFLVNGKVRLLVPKQFACKRMVKNASEYFGAIIIPHLQQEHLEADSPLVRRGKDAKGREWVKEPTKKDVRKDEHRYGPEKDRIRAYIARNFTVAEEYDEFTRKKLQTDGCIMSDQDLDDMIYGIGWKLLYDA